MGQPGATERLQRASPSYCTYLKLKSLPQNAPEFDVDETGLLRLEVGEHFCRVKTADGGLCGAKLGRDYNLRSHVESVHQTATKKPDKRRYFDAAVLREAEVFYARLLEGHEVPEEHVRAENETARTSPPKRKSTVIDLTAEDANPNINSTGPSRPKKKRPNKSSTSVVPLQKEQELEFELRKIALQKKMHAAELRELELQRRLAALKKN